MAEATRRRWAEKTPKERARLGAAISAGKTAGKKAEEMA
jgi:hypothetical protein